MGDGKAKIFCNFAKKSLKLLNKRLKAFSLLEIAISFAIVGVAVSCVSTLVKAFSIMKKASVNEERFQYVRIAMQAHLLRKGYLPYAANNENGFEENGCTKGYLPYKTLGIRKKYMHDADSRAFTYVVNGNLTSNNRAFIPMIFPYTTVVENRCVTFNRIYKYDGNQIEKYDDIDESKNIDVLENNVSVVDENDVIFVMPDLKKFELYEELLLWMDGYLTGKTHVEKYKTRNLIAWILISCGKLKAGNKKQIANRNSKNHFHLDAGSDILFYQTRYDMSAQAGFPATPEPIYGKQELAPSGKPYVVDGSAGL